jgi:hypothetical protein
MLPPNLSKLPEINIVGMGTSQISTLLAGTPSGFREIADKFGITPFDPQSLINQTGVLKGVEEFQKSIGVIGTQAIGTFSKLQTVTKNPAVILDWLN